MFAILGMDWVYGQISSILASFAYQIASKFAFIWIVCMFLAFSLSLTFDSLFYSLENDRNLNNFGFIFYILVWTKF